MAMPPQATAKNTMLVLSLPAMNPCTVTITNSTYDSRWMACHSLRGNHFITHDDSWISISK